ncbi:leucyl/phenylalanyl-tRNA--protein transferase [Cellvibrio polysaccharolyticus]|uniref:Leucyl/phenylalanyl-tRNA--protein transferase n=1 Tax=Cellvibrio polysaccharolyticus TaxID=2082724 RepID=A0A928YTM4_9GAMM|nr:leucyl/phenylalanyl-tRNA--protein transferase [Cellvibrio polysaccharolyticus]MBE8717012.1 leucyl/phenylalanyl-tRNA--protein transferase [Cellvibrio polysaccharolyticus]
MIPWLSPDNLLFPPVEMALTEPDGLLAAGGDLSSQRLLAAYHRGIFPWYNPGEPVLWWSPDPRTVIFPAEFQPSQSLRKLLRKNHFRITFDQQFSAVMRECAAATPERPATWISDDIIEAYTRLHHQGHAHSVEVWQDDQLAGGLYGIALGQVFFGESMFSRVSNASKIAFATLMSQLAQWQFAVVDCQVVNDHLLSLGAMEIPRRDFQKLLQTYVPQASLAPQGHWRAQEMCGN